MGPLCAAQAQANKVESMKKFLKNEDGLVTIEWVGIAAVMVLAAVAITGFVMNGADVAGQSVNTGLQSVASDAETPGPMQTFGDGT
jgi:Flp pilus assembly pilin Flp